MKALTEQAKQIRSDLIASHPHYAYVVRCVRFRWSNRMDQTAGYARYLDDLVTLSKPIFRLCENQYDFKDTVLHEIAHLIAGPSAQHGPIWKRIAKEIGCNGKRCHQLKVRPTRRVTKAIIQCNKCKVTMEVTQTRKTRMANGTTRRVMHIGCGGRFQ